MSFANDYPRRYRNTSSALPPLYYGYFAEPTPKLTSRTTNVKITKTVEISSTASAFGPASKQSWRTEVEASTTENYE